MNINHKKNKNKMSTKITQENLKHFENYIIFIVNINITIKVFGLSSVNELLVNTYSIKYNRTGWFEAFERRKHNKIILIAYKWLYIQLLTFSINKKTKVLFENFKYQQLFFKNIKYNRFNKYINSHFSSVLIFTSYYKNTEVILYDSPKY